MPTSEITLINCYFSRFYFHYEVDLILSESSGVLEISLDSLLEPEKRNVLRYQFSEGVKHTINDKVPLTGLIDGDFVFALCLFDSKGQRVLAGCSFPIQLSLERDFLMDYLFDYEIQEFSISEQKGVTCKVLIKNLGQMSWGEDCLPALLSFKIRSVSENTEFYWSDKLIEGFRLGSGNLTEVTFSSLECPSLKGIFDFNIELKIEDMIVTCSHEPDLKRLYLSGAKDLDKAKIEIFEASIKLNKYLTIKGRVENVGGSDWYMGPDVVNRYVLGCVIFNKQEGDNKYLGECRFSSETSWCRQGESFEFLMQHELRSPINNDLRLVVDLVREGSYWMREVSNSEVELIIEPSAEFVNEQGAERDLCRVFSKKSDEIENVLIVAPSLPLFDRESGGLRMYEILKQLVAEGKKVTYFYESVGVSSDPKVYIDALEELQLKIVGDLKPILFSTESFPGLIIFSIWSCAERYIDDLKMAFPKALIVADSVDLHWERERRAREAGLTSLTLSEWNDRKEREKAVYEKSDIVWLVTDEDKENLISECPSTRTMIVSNIHELREVVLNEKSFERPKGLFIGHFRHEPNISAGLEAIRVTKEYNKSHAEKISLYVVGDNAPEEIRELHDGSEILVMGHVVDVQALERRSAFLLAPLKYGAGIKGKICESISAGLPIITTDIGNEGLKLIHKEEAYIANDFQSSIDGIEYVLSDPNRAFSMVNRSRVKLEKYFSRSAVKPILKNLLDFTPITIAIVTYNQRDLLESCLASIFNLTSYPNFKVFVYSNGCTDGTLELISDYDQKYKGKFSYYRSNENDFFVKPNNKIIASCVPDDVVLLNNDTQIIDPSWLHELNFSAYSAPWIGASGCMVLDQDGKISEAGAKMNEDGIGFNLGRGDSPDNPAHNQVKYVDYVSGCCLYMKRSSIDLIGSLDEDFHPMYYEDSAWQFKLRNEGYKTVYTPRTRIIHKEGSSAGTDLNTGMKKFQAINREKFKKKFSSK